MSPVISVTDDTLRRAADILRGGGLVAMPTETVYGLAGNALDGKAVAKIFAAKGRPDFNPLIVHFADIDGAGDHVVLSAQARELAQAFCPGPLTLVLPRKPDSTVSSLAAAGLPTLAVRVPAHPVARALIAQAGVPLAAPSANRSGRLSPTTPQHVADDLGDDIDLILAAGPCAVGLESTVLDLSGDAPAILRPGAITAEDIRAVLGVEVAIDDGNTDTPKSPGQLLRHYAPSIPLRLNAIDVEPGEALLAFGPERFMAVRGVGAVRDMPGGSRVNLSEGADLHEAAANLFAMLHRLDRPPHTRIAVMNIPATGLGIAMNDRLKKAAAASTLKP